MITLTVYIVQESHTDHDGWSIGSAEVVFVTADRKRAEEFCSWRTTPDRKRRVFRTVVVEDINLDVFLS